MNRFLQDSLTLKALSAEAIQSTGFVRSVPGSEVYQTQTLLQFESTIAKGIIAVQPGYLTDLASIPNAAQGIFLKHDDPVILRPSVIHDLLYGNKGRITVEANGRPMPMLLTRQECDFILCYEAMRVCGASEFQIACVYDALRVFGDSWGFGYPLAERFCLASPCSTKESLCESCARFNRSCPLDRSDVVSACVEYQKK